MFAEQDFLGRGESDAASKLSLGTRSSSGLRFRVLRPHARGSCARLRRGRHRASPRVALKQILDGLADDPTSRRRFLVEAEIAGGLEHPGIVPVYGLGSYADGRPFYAMRFIKGDSLKKPSTRFTPTFRSRATPAGGRSSCGSCCGGSSTYATRSSTRTVAAWCTAI